MVLAGSFQLRIFYESTNFGISDRNQEFELKPVQSMCPAAVLSLEGGRFSLISLIIDLCYYWIMGPFILFP